MVSIILKKIIGNYFTDSPYLSMITSGSINSAVSEVILTQITTLIRIEIIKVTVSCVHIVLGIINC